jgi:kynurenine formamidase
MIGRGVLLDMARHLGVDWLDDGFAITKDMLDECARAQRVEIGRGDHLLIRTGHMEAKWAAGSWDGYPGGDAPGLAFETLDWLQAKQVAAVATDTWGVEVRPNETDEANQPWHWICIPIMGLTMGEIFKLDELAKACAGDKVYEFMFVAPALPITGAVGSPVNPIAIR